MKPYPFFIKVDPDKCDYCGACVGVCPEDCIELAESELTIIDSLCTRCSKCVWICPVEAFHSVENPAVGDKVAR
jgi:ferredoxin